MPSDDIELDDSASAADRLFQGVPRFQGWRAREDYRDPDGTLYAYAAARDAVSAVFHCAQPDLELLAKLLVNADAVLAAPIGDLAEGLITAGFIEALANRALNEGMAASDLVGMCRRLGLQALTPPLVAALA